MDDPRNSKQNILNDSSGASSSRITASSEAGKGEGPEKATIPSPEPDYGMERGYLKLWHKIEDWEWWGDATMMGTWLYMLKTANVKKKVWLGTAVNRGQFISSRAHLAKALSLTEQQVRTVVTKLKSTNQLTSKSTSRFTLYTIVNYEKYQMKFAGATSKTTSKSTSKQPASNQRATTTIECKNVRTKEVTPKGVNKNLSGEDIEKRIIGYYLKWYEKTRGKKITISWGMARKKIRELLTIRTVDEIKAVIEAMAKEKRDFWQENFSIQMMRKYLEVIDVKKKTVNRFPKPPQ